MIILVNLIFFANFLYQPILNFSPAMPTSEMAGIFELAVSWLRVVLLD